jgi:hypothetical protein
MSFPILKDYFVVGGYPRARCKKFKLLLTESPGFGDVDTVNQAEPLGVGRFDLQGTWGIGHLRLPRQGLLGLGNDGIEFR